MGGRLIGSCRREAIDWVQDLLLTTRPIAERTVLSALAEGKAVERPEGVVLLEDDQDTEKRARQQVVPIRNRRGARIHKGRGQQGKSSAHRSHTKSFSDGFGRFSNSKDDDVKPEGK